MPDERVESIKQGIGAPDESEIGKQKEAENRALLPNAPEMESAMGGTSDVDSPADESFTSAQLNDDAE